MYDESEDFRVHRAEIEGAVSVLANADVRLTPDMHVLDVGGGQGMHVGFLSALVNRVFCADVIDYSSLYGGEFLKLLDEKHRRHNVEFHLDRVAFHQTDAMSLLYRHDLFDCVLSINSFEHIPDPGKALAEMIRVTRPGGCIYISTDPIWTADTGSHFFHRVPEPWAHLLLDDKKYTARMRSNGASEDETHEYCRAMNRWRARDYENVVKGIAAERRVEVLHETRWSGTVDDAHGNHANLSALARLGFTRSELMVRGLRWVFRKR